MLEKYRPFLQRLATLPSDARKVDIELYLERFDRALIHSIACGEIRMEATMKLIEQKNLYMKVSLAWPLSRTGGPRYRQLICSKLLAGYRGV